MKTQFKILFSVATFLFTGLVASAQSGTTQTSSTEEVPGDNFSLEGALELFKKSASPQEFEQLLNSPDSKVNNLDLDGDGQIDYIRVVDKSENNVHDFILQAVISANESQDVAVIELQKRDDGTAVLQIVGDADIYGVETIIEPTSEVKVNAGTTTARTTVNVSTWPSVQFVYGYGYNPWVSPWYYGYYPGWYRPWRPLGWAVWSPYWAPYRPYYSMAFRHRIAYGPTLYRPYRTSSMFVYNRNYTQINHFRSMSRSYQYNHGGYAHENRGGHYNNGNNGGNGNNNGYNTRPSRSDYNSNNSSNSNNARQSRFSNTRTSQQSQSASPQYTRPTGNRFMQSPRNTATNLTSGRTFNSGSQRSTSFNRSTSFSRPTGGSPSYRSAPQMRSAPMRSGGGGGGHVGGGGRGGRH